ncbi:tetratricopeptide repeat protein [Geobacter anodireducens]|uniref:Tetratricopeptide repeat protein n=2 Tax=Geobacter anodireducens TaxID=1340425 RepID=A0ABR9NRC2_9BACT|nr:tetratricopeptide repeat protein [Geobacter anodireducens]
MTMEHGTESFWTDIKRYEDILAKDPGSYCFAPLSELYRKVGLLDDAIMTARTGIGQHPEYVGGYMALGRACFEKGERTESRTALEKVVRVTPDNLLAQKLLSQIYGDAGETDLARRCLEIILSLNPDDLESRLMFDAMCRQPFESSGYADDLFDGAGADVEDESLLEEIEIIEELVDEGVDGEEVAAVAERTPPPPLAEESFAGLLLDEEPAANAGVPGLHDVLSTGTIADLYIAQGFPKKALVIYRELLDADPLNEALRNRMVDLKRRIDEDEARARESVLMEGGPSVAMAAGDAEFGEDVAAGTGAFESEAVFGSAGESAPQVDTPLEDAAVTRSSASVAGGDGAAAHVVSVLEGWLDSIRRIRQCRSVPH